MTETGNTVQREENGGRGRYVIHLADGGEAEMTFSRAEGVMVIGHTGVPSQHEGKGLAGKLVSAMIADARTEGFRVRPLCSYVAASFRRHPEWQDLLA